MVAKIGYVPREAQQQPMHAARQRAQHQSGRSRPQGTDGAQAGECGRRHARKRIGLHALAGQKPGRLAYGRRDSRRRTGEIMEECNTAEEAKRSREPTREGQ